MTDSSTEAQHAKRVIGQIMIGRCDGGLVEIAKACAARRKEIGSAWHWRLTLDGDTWDLDTVTGSELAVAEDLLGGEISYIQFDPRLVMGHRIALLIARLNKHHNVSLPQAVARVESLTRPELDDTIDMYEVLAAPKDGDSPTS